MKKIKYILLAVCMFLCSLFTVGCTLSIADNSQPIKDLRGTYELAVYETYTKDKTNYTTITSDKKEKDNLKAYLVITGGAYGYYIDNQRSSSQIPRASKIRLHYEMSQDGLQCITISYRHKDQGTSVCTLTIMDKEGLKEYVKALYEPLTGLESDGYKREWKKVSEDYSVAYIKSIFGEKTHIPR